MTHRIPLPSPARRLAASFCAYVALQACAGAAGAECGAAPCEADAASDEVSMLQTVSHFFRQDGHGSGGSFVRKTHFSDTTRFVFLAGIEGTGHHAWKDMLNHCGSSGGPCTDAGEDARRMLWATGRSGGLFQFYSQTSQKREELKDRYVDELRRLARNTTSPTLYALNAMLDGMVMSYPLGNEPDKVLHHPDVHLLAELAERAEVDLRILVLQRDPTDILLSTVYHRHFDPLPREALVLSDNAYVLHGQLSGVDDRFMKCTRLSPSQSDDLPGFLHPTLAGEHKHVWESMLELVEPSSPEAAKPEMAGFVSQLSVATARIDDKCSAA